MTNKIPENPDFDTPHVVLKHDRAILTEGSAAL